MARLERVLRGTADADPNSVDVKDGKARIRHSVDRGKVYVMLRISNAVRICNSTPRRPLSLRRRHCGEEVRSPTRRP